MEPLSDFISFATREREREQAGECTQKADV